MENNINARLSESHIKQHTFGNNSLTAEPEVSPALIKIIKKTTIRKDPEPIPSTS
jgi:hypothetical protein